LKLPAVKLQGIFSVEYDFNLRPLTNTAADLQGNHSLSTFNYLIPCYNKVSCASPLRTGKGQAAENPELKDATPERL